MTNYDRIFEEDINKEFFFNAPGYEGKKLMVGSISLNNAIERLKKDEYYTLVTYMDGEKLPEEYIPLNKELETGEIIATVNPQINFQKICKNSSSVQMISRLPGDEYLLGPGPDTFKLSVLVAEQLKELKEEKTNAGENLKI